MQLPARNAVFTVTKNKQQLIMLICDELTQDADFITAPPVYTNFVVTGETESPIDILKSVTIERVDLKTTHEEADHILAHQINATAQENQEGVSVFQMILMYSFCCFIIINSKPLNTSCHGISHQR